MTAGERIKVTAALLAVAVLMPGVWNRPLAVSAAEAEVDETNVQTVQGGTASSSSEKVILRIANWEEYIDEGGWDEEEAIELDNEDETVILGENSMVEDFEVWYFENYGVDVDVEYSKFREKQLARKLRFYPAKKADSCISSIFRYFLEFSFRI